MGKAFARTGFIPPRQHPWAQAKSDRYYEKLAKQSPRYAELKGYKRAEVK